MSGSELQKAWAAREQAEARSKIYRFLASVFAKEPTSDLLGETIRWIGSDPVFSWQPTEGKLEQEVETLAIEYCRLFVGPGKHLSIHESMWRGEDTLWGEITADVQRIYGECGMELDSSYKDLPDHISAELSFMAEACQREAKRWKDPKDPLLVNVLQIESEFLQEHLLQWAPLFFKSVVDTSVHPYYRQLGDFARDFILEEKECVAEYQKLVDENIFKRLR